MSECWQSGFAEFVQGHGKARGAVPEEVFDLRHLEVRDSTFELPSRDGELRIASGDLGEALQVGVKLVGCLDPPVRLGIVLTGRDQGAVGVASR